MRKKSKSKRKAPRPVSKISDSLKHFDELPNSANVRMPVVALLCGCSTITVWRRSKAGTLPAPRKLGLRTTVWNVGELRAALAT